LVAGHPFVLQRSQAASCCLIGGNQALVALALDMRRNGSCDCGNDCCPSRDRQLKSCGDSKDDRDCSKPQNGGPKCPSLLLIVGYPAFIEPNLVVHSLHAVVVGTEGGKDR